MGPLIVVASLIFVGIIVWQVLRQKQTRLQVWAEFQKNLLDKFASGQEFAAFLESEASQKFLDQLWSPRTRARDRVLSCTIWGVVLAALGLGLMALAVFVRDQRGVIFPGVVFLALGAGSLAAAWISHRLSQRWGEGAEPGARMS